MTPTFNLRDFLSNFNNSSTPSFVTNGLGFVLEANHAAADLFNVGSIERLKNKGLVSFVHRKWTPDFRNLLSKLKVSDKIMNDTIHMRPRSSESFRAIINGKVLHRSNMIVLIHWTVQDSSFVAQTDVKQSA